METGDLTKPSEQQGLFRKFEVSRVDGSDQPGGRHEGCEYFVLDVTHDQHARAALAAYAEACKVTHPFLSADLIERYGLESLLSQCRKEARKEALLEAAEVCRNKMESNRGFTEEYRTKPDSHNYQSYILAHVNRSSVASDLMDELRRMAEGEK